MSQMIFNIETKDEKEVEYYFELCVDILMLAFGKGNVTGILPPPGKEFTIGNLVDPEEANDEQEKS